MTDSRPIGPLSSPRPLATTGRSAGARPRIACCVALLLLASQVPAGAQPEEKQPATDSSAMKPTEVGVRFTPRMADVISKKIVQQMKGRYDLDDDQTGQIEKILGGKMMTFAQKNAATGRDIFEMMMETMIENDGRFPKEAAVQFAGKIQPMLPAIRDFMTDTAGQVGQAMTPKQRLKFTGDMAAATAGYAIFESRMRRWQEGKVGDNANPFFDPADNNPTSSPAEPEPEIPGEPPEHRQARKNVETWIMRQLDVESGWKTYLDRAVTYYGLNETQQTSAQAILDDCLKRAAQIKTPEWREKVMENRIARQLSWGLGNEVSQGPYMYKLESDFEKLRKPLADLETEFKRRIDSLPTSEQRATAREEIRKALQKKGVKNPPF